MQPLRQRVSATAAIVFTIAFAAPAYGEPEVVEAYSFTGGLTRDSLSDASLASTPSKRPATVTAARRPTATTDPKDFASVHSHHRHHEVRQTRPQVVVTKGSKHRNPVVGFVYWWNGWVIRTFHTKFGTVLLGTIGAKT